MNHPRFLLPIVILLSVGADTAVAEDPSYEVISEADYGFLMGQPKIPWGEDPFLRVPGFASVPSVEEKFTLGGIMFSKHSPAAVVNGKMVQEGDFIGSRFVKKIGQNYVILKRKQSEIELSLPPNTEELPIDERDEEGEEAQ